MAPRGVVKPNSPNGPPSLGKWIDIGKQKPPNRAIGGIYMKAHFSGLVVLALCLTATPAGALNDDWLKDDQAFLQNQMSQYQNNISQLENVKQTANLSKLNIAAGNGSASDYANVAMWEAQKHQYKQLQNQMREAQHALHKVNNHINELGTRRPPQKHRYPEEAHRAAVAAAARAHPVAAAAVGKATIEKLARSGPVFHSQHASVAPEAIAKQNGWSSTFEREHGRQSAFAKQDDWSSAFERQHVWSSTYRANVDPSIDSTPRHR